MTEELEETDLINGQILGEHLNQEELERLLAGDLSGERLVAVLLHLEQCRMCSEKGAQFGTSQQLLVALFGEEELPAEESDCSPENFSQRKKSQRNP